MRFEPLLFTVGPVLMNSDILEVGGQQLPYFRTQEFSEVNLDISRRLKTLVYTDAQSEVVLLTASGTAAMEATVMNCFSNEDNVLIVVGGTFGQRFERICQIHNIHYTSIYLRQGEVLKLNMLDEYRSAGYTGLLINAHETSTGVYHDMSMVGEFCREEGLLLVVDAISTFLADPYYMDEWNIDATIISSQKALSVAPGVSIVIVNRKAVDRIEHNNVRSLYFDFKDYLRDIRRGQTPYTPAVGILLQVAATLRLIESKGISNFISDTEQRAVTFRAMIKGLPFTIPSERLSNALTPLRPRDGVSAYEIYLHLKDNFDIFVTPSGGSLRDTLFRVGHIGNLSINDTEVLADALHKMNKEGLL